jgi:hypothetical protein
VIPRFIGDAFPTILRARGQEYFSSGHVQQIRSDRTSVVAVVVGSDRYHVRLDAQPGLFTVGCTCPYSADHGVCKHTWALLTNADAEGSLAPLIEVAGKHAVFSTEHGVDDAIFDEHAAPEWKRLLDAAGRGMSHLPRPDAEQQASWPKERRLVYVIDAAATFRSAGIVVELGTQRRKRDGTWDIPRQFRMSSGVWHAAPDPLDRQIAQMLVGSGAAAAFMSPMPASQFTLREAALETTLRAMCETGRCFVRSTSGSTSAEPVRWDDGDPWQLRLHVDRETADFMV